MGVEFLRTLHAMAPPPPTGEAFVVLVIEDDPDHAALIQAAFAYQGRPCHVHVTGSSEEAMDYLLGRWPFGDRVRHPFPHVMILDLGLPGMDGLGFLRWLQSRPETWSATPVVVFTANAERGVAVQAYAFGARDVKVKPAGFPELSETVAAVLRRWKPHIA